jgi:hypothetical protein
MLANKFIKRSPSLVIACDLDSPANLDRITEAATRSPLVGALKIGFSLVCRFGMDTIVGKIRERTSLPIIYDHQKAGTDIPDPAETLAKVASSVDGVILFPMAGPEVQRRYTTALQDAGKRVIVGATMTHKQYLEPDGGYIAQDSGFIQKTSIWDLDRMLPGWEADVADGIDSWFPVGLTQFGIHPQLTAPLQVVLTYIALPVPVVTPYTGLETVDFQQEYSGAFIDYAAHILTAKEGGEEFIQSAKLYDRFLSKMSELSNFAVRKDRLRFTRTMGVAALLAEQGEN